MLTMFLIMLMALRMLMKWKIAGKTTALKVKATLLDAAYNGSGQKLLVSVNTMYAVFNGIEEAVEHSLGGNRVKDRGYNILFGTGKQIVDTAYNTSLMTMGIAA